MGEVPGGAGNVQVAVLEGRVGGEGVLGQAGDLRKKKELIETGGASFDFARVENQLYVVVLRAFC